MLKMLKLFRGASRSPHQTTLAMLGIRPGDAVLLIGASHPDLAGAVGAVTGLNGQTTVVDRREGGEARTATAAAAAGALVDYEDAPLTLLPFDPGRWDVAVLVGGRPASGDEAADILAEAVRVVRPGGRLVLYDPVGRPGWFGRRRSPAAMLPADAVIATLTGHGLRGARLLANVEGIRYFEAVTPRAT